MSVPWFHVDENPNPTGGCACYRVNNPDSPGGGGYLNPAREFGDLGHQSPHVLVCDDCPNGLKFESTAVEIVAPKRKAASRTS